LKCGISSQRLAGVLFCIFLFTFTILLTFDLYFKKDPYVYTDAKSTSISSAFLAVNTELALCDNYYINEPKLFCSMYSASSAACAKALLSKHQLLKELNKAETLSSKDKLLRAFNFSLKVTIPIVPTYLITDWQLANFEWELFITIIEWIGWIVTTLYLLSVSGITKRFINR
jgi:hypothetical protein